MLVDARQVPLGTTGLDLQLKHAAKTDGDEPFECWSTHARVPLETTGLDVLHVLG